MKLPSTGLLGLLAICVILAVACAEHANEPSMQEGLMPQCECVMDDSSLYLELYSDGSKKINVNSMYRLLPSGPIKHLLHFKHSKVAGLESIDVPLALGLHRPQGTSEPMSRGVAASTAQQFLMEEFYASRFIEFAVNNIELPLTSVVLGACIIYTYRSVRNQLGISSSLPDIHRVATMTFQLPDVRDDDFKRLCMKHLASASTFGRSVAPSILVSQVCSQVQYCVDDSSVLNSVITLRETLSNRPESLATQDSVERAGFISHIRSRFQNKALNVSLLRLYRLVCRLDLISTAFFSGKATSAFVVKDQRHMDSWQQIVEYLEEKSSGSMTCEDLLRLHLKAFPLLHVQLNINKRNRLSRLLCTSSEQALNSYLVPFSPASVSLQYLMYLNEYLELPLELISKSQCIFFLSASYTGMFPRFEHSAELAVLLDQLRAKSKEEFLPRCVQSLPKYVNLAENTYIPNERIVVNRKRDSSEICSAIFECFSSGPSLSENDLATLFVSTISHGGEFFSQLLPRAKFITKTIEKRRDKDVASEPKVDSVVESGLLPPAMVIDIAGTTHDPAIAIKVQRLYSLLVRVALLLTDSVHISEVSKVKRPLSLPKEFISEKNPDELVPSISNLSAILSNSLVPSDCASGIIKKIPELGVVAFTLTSLCEYVLSDSYPTPFSGPPYLLKLVAILSDNYGFSVANIRRIHAYAASSYTILGVQIRLLPLFSFVSRHSLVHGSLKSEYNICIENFQFKLFFTSSQIQDKKESFCRYTSLVLDDEFYERSILFAIKTYSRRSFVEENWYRSLSYLISDVRSSINSSIGLSLTVGYSIGDGSKFFPFFISRYIRNIQKSSYAGELTTKDIIRIFTSIYTKYEMIPDVGSSSFIGNSLRYEFISSKDSSKDMSNFKLVSDEIFGLRYIFSQETMLESYPYLVESCETATLEHVRSVVNGNLDPEKVKEICQLTFSTPNKELPLTQHSTNTQFLNYLANYFSVPQQVAPQLHCIYKVVGAFSNPPEGIPSFEVSLSFGMNLFVLTHGFRNVEEATFGDKCKIAALLSNILNTDVGSAIYEDLPKSDLKNSLQKRNLSPINAKQVSSFCSTVHQCSKSSQYDRHVRDYISSKTLYNFIYNDHFLGDPIASSNIKLSKGNGSASNELIPQAKVKQSLEKFFEKSLIEGLEITHNGNNVRVQGLRVLESIRLYGVFHDSFRDLLRKLDGKDVVSQHKFSGLYSGLSPIKGRDDSIDDMKIFSLETAALVVHKISVSISENDKVSETQSFVLSAQKNSIHYCKEHLKSVLSEGFSLYEIRSICSVTFSAFKY